MYNKSMEVSRHYCSISATAQFSLRTTCGKGNLRRKKLVERKEGEENVNCKSNRP